MLLLLNKVLSLLPFKKKLGWFGIVISLLGLLAQAYPEALIFSVLAQVIQHAQETGVIPVDMIAQVFSSLATGVGGTMTALGYARAKVKEKVEE